ncbi:hypothetical protein [Jeotgalibacillus aurantiacus]|uniref:hypothetical protein n=1 Tax=Jeotgalibacillus aurantiacus TaxID=2763266 RepID=UPI001D09F9EB|nr:hypothetical protein [Jeotgalibacillus aurantiacus]
MPIGVGGPQPKEDYDYISNSEAGAAVAEGKEVQFMQNGKWVTIIPIFHNIYLLQTASGFRVKKGAADQ